MVFIELVIYYSIYHNLLVFPLNYQDFFVQIHGSYYMEDCWEFFGLEKQNIDYNIRILAGYVAILICNFLVNPGDEFKIDAGKIMRFYKIRW